MIKKYRKNPVVIEAIQFTGDNGLEIYQWMHPKVPRIAEHGQSPSGAIGIKTPEGNMLAQSGDYIIKEITGEFYPCQKNIFESTYTIITIDES